MATSTGIRAGSGQKPDLSTLAGFIYGVLALGGVALSIAMLMFASDVGVPVLGILAPLLAILFDVVASASVLIAATAVTAAVLGAAAVAALWGRSPAPRRYEIEAFILVLVAVAGIFAVIANLL